MHCELAVPGLLGSPPPARLPALELLLARGRAAKAEPQALEGWLRDAFGAGAAPLAAGALTFIAAGGDPGEDWWTRADPVHLRVMRDHAVLLPGAELSLSPAESDALREALNRHFAARLALHDAGGQRWIARLEGELESHEISPLEAAGREVDIGAQSARAAALVNEAQMLLHAHPVNEAREARGEPQVNSIWLWGAGRAPRAAQGRWRSVTADDPVALGLARLAGAHAQTLPAGLAAWLEHAPHEGRHLVVLDGLRYAQQAEALERDWFAPLAAALRAGRIGMLSLHVPDGAVAFETVRGDLRRFWRRPKALERYA
jgi:hypothetical protein